MATRVTAFRNMILVSLGLLMVLAFTFNGQLLSGSLWCDQRVARVANEKEASMRQAMEQLSDALERQADTLRKLQAERTELRKLRHQLAQIKRGGSSSRRVGQAPMEAPAEERTALAQASAVMPSRAATVMAAPEARSGATIPAGDGGAPLPPVTAAADGVASAGPGTLEPSTIAVVVIAYNRPEYLDRALTSVQSHHPGAGRFEIYVSQDGENEGVRRIIEKHKVRRLVHPRRTLQLPEKSYIRKVPGYAYLAVHYGWALQMLFDVPREGGGGKAYEGVIILEEDIEVAPDFFDYFSATAPLLYQDDSLLCISAFNDNGQARYAGDEAALHRSDFFPGLGWIMSRRLWAQLGPIWPDEKGFWDDWLREPPQRRGRTSIFPEVSRTFTFGAKGVSTGQFFHKYLGKVQLNAKRVDWGAQDVRRLLKARYDEAFERQLSRAPKVSLDVALSGREDVRVLYNSAKEFSSMCRRLGIMEDLKAGVPRTGYKGVVIIKVNSRHIFLCPSYRVDQDITKPVSGVPFGGA